ncbi:MAG: lysophospholipid acyltransferase family protein [Fibrobacter sp.]|nr:lysophospholipid acyltransferase family protein [Fibrobacter sp.]
MFFKGKIVAAVFAQVAYTVLKLAGWKRKTVLANAKHVAGAVPNADSKILLDYNILLKNLTRHASELLFCFGTFKRLPADFSKYPCCVDGWNFALDEAAIPVLEKMRSGGIFLTAHYGNYEAMGPWLCRLGIPLVASYIPVKPKWLNNILERKIRAVDGRSYSVDARTPRDFLRILNDGKLFCLLADQDSRIPSALPGTFLGCPANVNPLPDFLLKHRPQTPVYICWMEERGAFSGDAFLEGSSPSERRIIRVLHAIEVERAQVADSAQFDVASPAHLVFPAQSSPSVVNTQFNKWLEERIAENPNLWYGFTHRRFYSQSPTIY